MENFVKWGLGALGLGALASVITNPNVFGISIAVGILSLAMLLFGSYYLWSQQRAKKQRERFSSAIEEQSAGAPRSISDPNKRAALDKVRQKFQTGLQEFKSRGKDIYKLPWYVIIGESGSGKTEAIRHSGIDFPPGMQDELQGSGGTVNMDWWFTNRGIILDTAGSMIFNEARAGESPEWREFLRLLKKSRPHSPVNGLFLVLSIESIIKDSSDKIAQKAGVLAQQLDLIQKTLDVRFPVYLLITKSDLLTGFREFFDNLEDPLLQHQIFGWSNPDDLDSPFRPELVEEHLKEVAGRVCRRRLAMLREAFSGSRPGDTSFFNRLTQPPAARTVQPRHLDEVDKLYALPESIMRLAPRLRLYLQTIFVAGEWSAKPVFLRGIYFTSSMREGKALDEAIANATGLTLDQLPEDRSWDKNRAYFLRDLLHEKVFQESGLVTRATNTLKLLKSRQLLVFGTAGLALGLLTLFAWSGYRDLQRSVGKESRYWQIASANWNQGSWMPAIVTNTDVGSYAYAGAGLVDKDLTLVDYHARLAQVAEKEDFAVNWIFLPLKWGNVGQVKDRPLAQRRIFEAGVLKPLVVSTRDKIKSSDPGTSLPLYRNALLSLLQLEADGLKDRRASNETNLATGYLTNYISFLTGTSVAVDPGLVDAFVNTYSAPSLQKNHGGWPPANLLGGNLSSNAAIAAGLERYQEASKKTQTSLLTDLDLVNQFADSLIRYQQAESSWLNNPASSCPEFLADREKLDGLLKTISASTNVSGGFITNLAACYVRMAGIAYSSSASMLMADVQNIRRLVPNDKQQLFVDVVAKLKDLGNQAASDIQSNYDKRSLAIASLDAGYLAPATSKAGLPAYQARWQIYTNACALSQMPLDVQVGEKWEQYNAIGKNIGQFKDKLPNDYTGPLDKEMTKACCDFLTGAQMKLEDDFVKIYADKAKNKLDDLSRQRSLKLPDAADWLDKIQVDLKDKAVFKRHADSLSAISGQLPGAKIRIVENAVSSVTSFAGFPVTLRGSASTMTVAGMNNLGKEIKRLRNELGNNVWQDVTQSSMTALDSYAGVIDALVVDGRPAKWKLKYVADGSNSKIISILRDVKVTIDGKPYDWKEMSNNHEALLADDADVDKGIQFDFRANVDSPSVSTFGKNDWSLVRLITDGSLNPSSKNGIVWRFAVPLKATREDPATRQMVDYVGNVIFEAELLSGRLPTSAWPR